MASNSKDRLKMALIPVLALMLLVVLWRNLGSAGSDSDAELALQPVIKKPRPVITTVTVAPITWPKLDISQLVALNPFSPLNVEKPVVDPPAVEPPSSPEVPSTTMAEPPAGENAEAAGDEVEEPVEQHATAVEPSIQKIDFIYETGGERVAVVDSQRLRVGDTVAEGRVIKITPTEVVIEYDLP